MVVFRMFFSANKFISVRNFTQIIIQNFRQKSPYWKFRNFIQFLYSTVAILRMLQEFMDFVIEKMKYKFERNFYTFKANFHSGK
jgi:hypothetical protein